MTTTQDECLAQSSSPAWNLPRVIYAVAGVIAVWFALGTYDSTVMSRYMLSKDPAALRPLIRATMAAPFVYIIALALVIWFFRPVTKLFRWDREPTRVSWWSVAKQVLLGLAAGLLVSLLCAGFPITDKNFLLVDIAERLSGSNTEYLLIPIFLLLVTAVAICTEVVFRGIVLRTLADHSNLPSSIIASCLLPAYFWSFNRPAVTVAILGIVSGILFYKTRSLLASIVTSSAFLTTGPLCSAIFHRLIA